MSGAENINSEIAPAGGRGKKIILLLVVLLLLGGAGGGGYFYFIRKAGGAEEEASEKSSAKEKKSKSKKSDEDGGDEESGKSSKLKLPEDDEVKEVVEFQPFIVNLADGDQARYLRLNVSVGVGEGGGEKPGPLFVTRIRNAMLEVLSSKTSEDVLSSDGKNKLRRELLKAAQQASEEPQVKAIYITDFIVQM